MEGNGGHVGRRVSPSPEVLERKANAEVVERVGGKEEPPRYEDVVGESAGSLGKGRRGSGSSSEGGSENGEEEKGLSRYQQRRAERAARRAEKAARKADRAALGL